MASEKKSFGQVWSELLASLAKTSLLPERKQDKVRQRIVLSAANDLLQSVKEIPDDEIEIVSTGIRAFCQASEKIEYLEVNNTIQRWLEKKAKSKETKEFVSKNMD